jgi:hypothetical protein
MSYRCGPEIACGVVVDADADRPAEKVEMIREKRLPNKLFVPKV